MAQFLGMYRSKRPRALQGFYDAPYLMMGRHVVCGKGYASEDGVAALAVGWIRNAAQIRASIQGAGVSLTADVSLSALLLNAYRLWGKECVRRLEGPAILIVVDQKKDLLLLASDRMGEAGPVFYAETDGCVSFAGHPAPLLEVPGVTRNVDADGWREIFGLGPARTPGRTPYRDIRALRPGLILMADVEGIRTERYFSLEARPHEDGEKETIEKVRELTVQAVADAARFQPVSMLSGGLDSTVLTALLARQTGRPVRTFSLDYEDNERHFTGGSYQPEQDGPYVEKAVRAIDCSHTRVVLRIESLLDALNDAVSARGFPGMADIDSSLLIFSRRIAGDARHVVSGECGDEVFGGYPWFRREELIWQENFPWSGSLKLRRSVLWPEIEEKLRLEEYVSDGWRDAKARQVRADGESQEEARLRLLQGICFEYFMGNLQERASAMGAAAGLTVLTPYCDDRLVQYLFNVPWKIKALGGQEKGLLRRAMQNLLPDDLLWRKKSPYPKTHHPLYTQLVRESMMEILSDPYSPILQLIDPKAVARLTESDLSPSETPWFGQLMAGPQMLAYLIQVNQWMLRYRVSVAV